MSCRGRDQMTAPTGAAYARPFVDINCDETGFEAAVAAFSMVLA